MSGSYDFPGRFTRESLDLVNRLVPLSRSAFFLVDPDMRHCGAVLYNLKPDAEKAYRSEYGALDPLNPQRFAERDDVVVTLDACMSPRFLRQTRYYREFMVPHNHRFVADVFFRRGGRIVAGLSLMREEALGEFTEDELALLKQVQPFLEYTLNAVYLPRREAERAGIAGTFQLTERELDVLELVLGGRGNKAIAAELSLGLATVKTHLHHIFRKVGVGTRGELVVAVRGHLEA